MAAVDRTVILLDCKQSIGNILPNSIDFTVKTSRTEENGIEETIRIQRNILSSCIQAVSEYCRIVYDIFPEESQVMVLSNTKESTVKHNSFHVQHQNLQEIMDHFTNISPQETTSLLDELKVAIDSLTEPNEIDVHRERDIYMFEYSKKPLRRNLTRIVLLLPPQLPTTNDFVYKDGRLIQENMNIRDTVSALIADANEKLGSKQRIDHCDLEVVKISEEGTSIVSLPSEKVSPTVTATVHVVPSMMIQEFMSQRILDHYSLSSVNVSGIPMKERDATDASRAIYDVTLLYPSPQPSKDRTLLRWKSIDRKTNPDTLPCKSVHRVTAIEVTSAPSICLMKHILSGKPVTLVTIDGNVPPGAIPSTSPLTVSHVLLSHGEDVYLHVCSQTPPLSLLDLPVDRYSNVSDLRVKDFCNVIDSSILRLPRSAAERNPDAGFITLEDGTVCSKGIEKLTRYFPYSDDETLLFSSNQASDLKMLLDPVKETLLHDELSRDQVETCVALVSRFFQCCSQLEIRLFPQLYDRPQQRNEAYAKLWKELHTFVEMYATEDKPGHTKVLQLMNTLWAVETPQKPQVTNQPATPTQRNPPQRKPITPSHKRPSLYSHLSKTEGEGDIWTQYELAQKAVEEEEWKKSDPSQKPVEEMEIEKQGHDENKRRKFVPKFDQLLEKCDESSLFHRYWTLMKDTVQTKEFDGRLQE